jgi:hypothetical protein
VFEREVVESLEECNLRIFFRDTSGVPFAEVSGMFVPTFEVSTCEVTNQACQT